MAGPLRDFLLDASGNLAATSTPGLATVSGIDAIAQHVRIRLRAIKSECIWDLDLGVDWAIVFRKGATDNEISNELTRVIVGTPGVTGLESLTINRNSQTRRLSVTFVALCDLGKIAETVALGE